MTFLKAPQGVLEEPTPSLYGFIAQAHKHCTHARDEMQETKAAFWDWVKGCNAFGAPYMAGSLL